MSVSPFASSMPREEGERCGWYTICSSQEYAHRAWTMMVKPKRSTYVRQTIRKTLGMALASMGLVSTFALAQPSLPGVTLVCTKSDSTGYCIEAKAQDDKMVTVRVQDVKVSEKITCIPEGSCWIPGSWICRWRPTHLWSP